MYDFIDKYILQSKKSLKYIIKYLDDNIKYLEQNLWTSNEELIKIIDEIVDIYYDKYYLYDKSDFSNIDKYIVFNNKINRKLKLNLLSIIDYFINNKKELEIQKKEGTILYLTILMYIAEELYNTNFNNINDNKKLEEKINNIINNFSHIEYRNESNLNELINNIKEYIEKNTKFNKLINKFNNNESYNNYIKVNKDNNYYKVLYQYNLNELNKYDSRDILNIIKKMNIKSELFKISFDISYITIFKSLIKGIDIILLIDASKEDINYFIDYKEKNNLNKNILNKIKFVLNYEELNEDYDFINKINDNNIDLFIEIKNSFETDNYNMFMGINRIIVPEEFLSINEKYLEIWKDMGMVIIKKDMDKVLSEKELLGK